MLGFYNPSVILTYISLAIAVVGVSNVVNDRPGTAVLCLMLCGICDMFDGAIARMVDRNEDEKAFGVQIDSLCDMVCFGVLPSVIAYRLGLNNIPGTAVCILFTLAALIRLAYFNVTEEKRRQATTERRKSYEGLPVTNIAAIFPYVYMFHKVLGGAFVPVLAVMLLLVGFLYLSRIQIPKPHVKTCTIMLFIGLAGLLILYCLLH